MPTDPPAHKCEFGNLTIFVSFPEGGSPARPTTVIWVNTSTRTWGFQGEKSPAYLDAADCNYITSIVNKISDFAATLNP